MAGLMDYDAEENLEKEQPEKSSFRWNFRNAAVCEVQQRQIVKHKALASTSSTSRVAVATS